MSGSSGDLVRAVSCQLAGLHVSLEIPRILTCRLSWIKLTYSGRARQHSQTSRLRASHRANKRLAPFLSNPSPSINGVKSCSSEVVRVRAKSVDEVESRMSSRNEKGMLNSRDQFICPECRYTRSYRTPSTQSIFMIESKFATSPPKRRWMGPAINSNSGDDGIGRSSLRPTPSRALATAR